MVGTLLLSLLALAAAGHLVFVARKLWMVRSEAADAWTHRDEVDAIDTGGLDEAAFKRAYFRAHGPRGALHVYAGVVLAAVLTGPALAILGQIWALFWRLAGEPRAYAPGNLIWQFFLYFSLIAFWVVVAHAVVRRYHRSRPRGLRVEIVRERMRTSDTTETAAPPS